MKVYISGKITGLDIEKARDNFFLAEMNVRMMGLTPINPMNKKYLFNKVKKIPWLIYMICDICLLLKCTGIYLQENWQESKGARVEYRVAKFFGCIIIKEKEEGK